MTDNIKDMSEDTLRYNLTIKAREWARETYTRKDTIKEKEKAVVELVRDPTFINYVAKLISSKPEIKTTVQTNMSRHVPVADIDYDSYLPYQWGSEYIQIKDEAEELESFIMSKEMIPYLIESEKGMGKTLLITDIALKHKIPLITMSCSSGTRTADLEGRTHVDEQGSYYQLGVLPTAIELANHFGHAILFLDEINALENELQKRLNPILDERRNIYVNGKLYKLNKDCRLSIVAAMNPVTYTGVNTLNEDLKSRFAGKVWNHSVKQQIDNAVNWNIDGQDKDTIEALKISMITLCENMRNLRIKGELSYSLSIRDIKQFVSVLSMFAKGLDLTVPKIYERVVSKTLRTTILNHKLDTDEERKSMAKLLYDVLGVEVMMD